MLTLLFLGIEMLKKKKHFEMFMQTYFFRSMVDIKSNYAFDLNINLLDTLDIFLVCSHLESSVQGTVSYNLVDSADICA